MLRENSLKTARAWALNETAMELFGQAPEEAAKKHFNWWCNWATHMRLTNERPSVPNRMRGFAPSKKWGGAMSSRRTLKTLVRIWVDCEIQALKFLEALRTKIGVAKTLFLTVCHGDQGAFAAARDRGSVQITRNLFQFGGAYMKIISGFNVMQPLRELLTWGDRKVQQHFSHSASTSMFFWLITLLIMLLGARTLSVLWEYYTLISAGSLRSLLILVFLLALLWIGAYLQQKRIRRLILESPGNQESLIRAVATSSFSFILIACLIATVSMTVIVELLKRHC